MVGNGHPPDFHIIIGGDGDAQAQRNLFIAAFELNLMRKKVNFLVVGLGGGRLAGCRPQITAVLIQDI